MQFIFKTNYDQDIRLIQHRGHCGRTALLLGAAARGTTGLELYLQSQFVFVFIYAIVGVALMILTGFTGQGSLGHAAFLAIGAYTTAYLQSKGVPFAGAGLFRSTSICRGSAPANCGSHTLATFSGPACSPASSVPSSAFRRCDCMASTC